MTAPLDVVSVAAWRLVRAQRAVDEARALFRSTIVEMYQLTPDLRKHQVAGTIRDDLGRHGFDDALLARLALSDASVRLVLAGVRKP